MINNTIHHLRMFDTVLTYAFNVQKPKEFDGLQIPQEEFQKFENARIFALDLNRKGLLEEMYKRIIRGEV